jgi:hypothetical protein
MKATGVRTGTAEPKVARVLLSAAAAGISLGKVSLRLG